MPSFLSERDRKAIAPFLHLFPPLAGRVVSPVQVQGLAIGDGWLPLLDELLRAVDAETCTLPRPPVVVQIKEKLGELRIYMLHATPEVQALVDAATVRSRSICEGCGVLSQVRSRRGWLTTRCNSCLGVAQS